MFDQEFFRQRNELEPDYIGDAVYASTDGYQIWLRTERDGQVHEITLDSYTFAALLRYRDRVKGA